MSFKTISVIGLGYIGLPTAAMFASSKQKVIGVDVNQSVVDTINRGEIHIVEPKLNKLVKKVVTNSNLRATTVAEESDVFIIAVPTPFIRNRENESPTPDISFIEAACKNIAKVLKEGDLIILESTSPVGTTDKISQWLSNLRKDLSFPHSDGDNSQIRIAYCPERVLPGNIIDELIENDRVIGGMSKRCSELAVDVYQTFVSGRCHITSHKIAEMAKLTENASRDVQIAFANELSILCDDLGIDVWELIKVANHHPRVNILQPGPGVGGHCIAVDPWFIISNNPKDAKLIKTARDINDNKPEWVIGKIEEKLRDILLKNPDKSLADITVTSLGLTFKPDIDDLRGSPALKIAEKLCGLGLKNNFFVDPNVKNINTKLEQVDLSFALKSSDLIVILVDHKEFKSISDEEKKNFKGEVLDTRGIWENE